MAQVIATPKEIADAFEWVKGENFDAYSKRSDAMFRKLQLEAEALPEGEVVGAIVSFPRADGYAMYRVASAKPLKLQHLSYLDGYHADPITIRGLRLPDVQAMLGRKRAMAKLFPFRQKEAA